ncbi:ESPR domain-containing protein [Veillonella magna]|nr:ESPR domain-containing protein [Veillonella magna]
MNHVFRVVWSKTKHCYVVVSELAGIGRNAGKKE